VRQAQPFHFFDPHHQPTKCELVVCPAQGWAVATELPDAKGAGLMHSLTTLASKVCTEYNIAPAQLSLFARYAYSDEATGWYMVRFDHSDRDLFDGVRFLAPTRKEVPPDVAGVLLKELASGQAPALEWRAVPFLADPSTTS
jgi:hypothetical protein